MMLKSLAVIAVLLLATGVSYRMSSTGYGMSNPTVHPVRSIREGSTHSGSSRSGGGGFWFFGGSGRSGGGFGGGGMGWGK